MDGKKREPHNMLPRRGFLHSGFRLALLGTLLPAGAFSNTTSGLFSGAGGNGSITGAKIQERKKKRKKWSYEGLVMNSKTHVLHLPTSKVYKYYDEITPAHQQRIKFAAWSLEMKGRVRFNRVQSGMIIEILSLSELKQGINDKSLGAASATLSRAFSNSCNNSLNENMNIMNFRLHELMLQLLALNATVPDKWLVFNRMVKRPPTLRKRQKWMETKNAFNGRVRYILERQQEYTNRLVKRAQKYSFT